MSSDQSKRIEQLGIHLTEICPNKGYKQIIRRIHTQLKRLTKQPSFFEGKEHNPALNNIYTMSSNWPKITEHIKKQTYAVSSQEKKKSTEIHREMIEIMELEEKGFSRSYHRYTYASRGSKGN